MRIERALEWSTLIFINNDTAVRNRFQDQLKIQNVTTGFSMHHAVLPCSALMTAEPRVRCQSRHAQDGENLGGGGF